MNANINCESLLLDSDDVVLLLIELCLSTSDVSRTKNKKLYTKTKILNRSIYKISKYKSHKNQIINHIATSLDTHIYKNLKPGNTGGKK
jgi:hypothetical protein